METMTIIRELELSDEIPYFLLLLADPSMEAIGDYLQRGTCYVVCAEAQMIGVCVLLKTRPFTMELVNLAVAEEWQGKNIAKRLIRHVVEVAKEEGAKVLEVGTGNAGIGQLALYQKCGFTIIGVEFDFFRKHYTEKIVENGIECRHMIRMSMDL